MTFDGDVARVRNLDQSDRLWWCHYDFAWLVNVDVLHDVRHQGLTVVLEGWVYCPSVVAGAWCSFTSVGPGEESAVGAVTNGCGYSGYHGIMAVTNEGVYEGVLTF